MKLFLELLTDLFLYRQIPSQEDREPNAMQSEMDREARRFKAWLIAGACVVLGLVVIYYRYLR
jgi:hypothetical protein